MKEMLLEEFFEIEGPGRPCVVIQTKEMIDMVRVQPKRREITNPLSTLHDDLSKQLIFELERYTVDHIKLKRDLGPLGVMLAQVSLALTAIDAVEVLREIERNTRKFS